MQTSHNELQASGQESKEHREIGASSLNVFVSHDCHERRRTDGDVLAGSEYHVNHCTHERGVKTVLQ